MSCLVVLDEPPESKKVVEKAKKYIQEHFADCDLSYAAVAENVHVSAGYFSTVFKSVTGENYQQYVIKLRLERAKELLRSTNLYTYGICYQVGYSSPQYFCASFKKMVGITPRKYRTSAMT